MINDFSVPNPCNEKWNGMIPKDNGRYCSSCQKTVIDFTNKTKEEIIDYMNKHVNQKICGTFKTSTLLAKTHSSEALVKFLAALLLVFGISLFSCTESNEKTNNKKEHDSYSTTGIPTYKYDSTEPPPIIETTIYSPPEIIETEECFTTGDIIPEIIGISPDSILPPITPTPIFDTLIEDEFIHTIAEKMPEFPGGTNELFKYIRSNFKILPETDYFGTMYISFIVKKDGSITDIKILKPSNTEYDEQLIELVKNMPKWTPGENDNKPVNVRFYLPIRVHYR